MGLIFDIRTAIMTMMFMVFLSHCRKMVL